MLSVEQNELITRIGPGTRMGSLLRRYWQPVAATEELGNRRTKRVRILGENLVLFRSENGQLGLVDELCPHRRVSLFYGIPVENGIKCPYHGWAFDGGGRCIEQPNEGGPRIGKVETSAYPVQEMGGLIWAYLGPQPVPLLPRFDGFVAEGAVRTISTAEIPCNWLQIMENSVDPVHVETLHGTLIEFLERQRGLKVPHARHHVRIGFDEFEYGIIKRRLLEGQTEEAQDWAVGHPLVFPQMVAVGTAGGLWQQYAFEIRVPIDDTHTRHYWYSAFMPAKDAVVPERLLKSTHWYEQPLVDEHGEYLMDFVPAQDVACWVTQGEIADRSREKLGSSDVGIIKFRRMLLREMEGAENGEDPIGTVRDAAENEFILLPMENGKYINADGFRRLMVTNFRNCPIVDDLISLFDQTSEAEAVQREKDKGAAA